MAKLRVPSWLHSSNGAATNGNADEADRKKQNRMSLSGLAQFMSKSDQPTPQSSSATETEPDATPPSEAAAVSSTSHMIELAKKITRETEKLDKFMRDNNLPNAGFDVNDAGDFPPLPADIQNSRQEIVYATRELGALVRGPREHVRWGVWSVSLTRVYDGRGGLTSCAVPRYSESPTPQQLRNWYVNLSPLSFSSLTLS